MSTITTNTGSRNMTTTKTAYQTIADAARNWDGETTIEQAVMEFANCRHAEVHPDGDVYIEAPMDGHYLDDDDMARLVAWMTDRKMI